MPILPPVVRSDGEGVAVDCVGDAARLLDVETVFDTADVVVEDSLVDETEIEVLVEAVRFDLITNPRLLKVSSTKPGGLPVEVCVPETSVSWKPKFGLIANSSSVTLSLSPIVQV